MKASVVLTVLIGCVAFLAGRDAAQAKGPSLGFRVLEPVRYPHGVRQYLERRKIPLHKFESNLAPGVSSDGEVYLQEFEASLDASGVKSKIQTDALTRDSRSGSSFRERARAFIRKAYGRVFSPEQIEHVVEAEEGLELERCGYVSFEDPRSRETKFMLRLFDGSDTFPVHHLYQQLHSLSGKSSPLPLERRNKLTLPGKKKAELGFYAKDRQVADMRPGLQHLADLLAFAHPGVGNEQIDPDLVVYVASLPDMASIYTAEPYGFSLYEGGPSVPNETFLSMTGTELCRRFCTKSVRKELWPETRQEHRSELQK